MNLNTINTRKKSNIDVKVLVMRAVSEVLSDPDFGLEMRMQAQKRLREANVYYGKTISFSEIKRKYS
ncbi:MAG: hypothetical protein AAB795_02590 [Patescibacteria group bacterium]